ncbi:MAG: class I SAM-dependent methyltransferase [Chitinophagia bacterium]|nr:class I SAM-dependent methyltransferase [Chitinophagia bacterium]
MSGFRKKFPSEKTIQASATKIPKPNNTYDLCILSAVSHHLQNSELDCALKEISRVLRPDGKFLFLDALSSRLTGVCRNICRRIFRLAF